MTSRGALSSSVAVGANRPTVSNFANERKAHECSMTTVKQEYTTDLLSLVRLDTGIEAL